MMPAGFSTSPCLSRCTMVESDIARPSLPSPGQTGIWIRHARPQRGPDLSRHVAGVIPHDERGEAQDAVAADGEVVVAVHVRPVLGRVHVMATVYLNNEPRFLPYRVKPPAAARRVEPGCLPVGRGHPVPADQPDEIQLGE